MYFKPSEQTFFCPDTSAVDDRGGCKSFCHKCQKHVHHIDRMTKEEAEKIRGFKVCTAMRLRPDGSIVFREQPKKIKFLVALSMSLCFVSSYAHYAEGMTFTSEVLAEVVEDVTKRVTKPKPKKFEYDDSVVTMGVVF